MLQTFAGHDPHDATTAPEPVPDYFNELNTASDKNSVISEAGSSPLRRGRRGGGVKDIRIGLPREYYGSGLKPEVRSVIEAAISALKKAGAEFIEIDLPHTKYGLASYYIITPSEISSNLARFDGIRYGLSATLASGLSSAEDERGDKEAAKTLFDVYAKSRGLGLGPEAKRRIMLGTYALSAGYYVAYYLKRAESPHGIIIKEFDRAFAGLDCLLTPTTPGPAFPIGEKSNDPLEMYLEDVFAIGASLAGLPAIWIPAGFVDNLPVGLQLIAKRFAEPVIFQIAGHFKKSPTGTSKNRIYKFYIGKCLFIPPVRELVKINNERR